MQESRARLHGWRRRGRMAGGGRGGGGGGGGGLGSKRERKEGRGGLDEKQLPQDGGVWMGGFGEEGRRVGGGGSGPHFAILPCSRPGLCWRPGGSESALTRPRFILPIRVRTDRGFQVRQALTPTTSVSSPMMTDKTTASFC